MLYDFMSSRLQARWARSKQWLKGSSELPVPGFLGKAVPGIVPPPSPCKCFCPPHPPSHLLAYLHGVVQLLGFVSVWSVHEGYDEPLELGAQLRLQRLDEILRQEQGRVVLCALCPLECRQRVLAGPRGSGWISTWALPHAGAGWGFLGQQLSLSKHPYPLL